MNAVAVDCVAVARKESFLIFKIQEGFAPFLLSFEGAAVHRSCLSLALSTTGAFFYYR